MKTFKAVIFSILTIALVWVLNSKAGDVPPLGKFLDPFHGFWKNAENKKVRTSRKLNLPGLKNEVTIKFDSLMIPHIFAKNDHDLYYAQGYVTAKDRLWQLDFQTRFASGTLSEVVGEKAIELDKYQRRMGMMYGAENMVKVMMKDPVMNEVMNAYADGINAYIHSLRPQDYPIEFKILDYKPQDWKPVNSALLLKLMSATLAGGSDEFYMSNILKKYGADVIKDLYPDYPVNEDPIIPKGTEWNFKPLEIPEAPKNGDKIAGTSVTTRQLEEGIGSNNWALSGSKTASGKPILANDPHLDLSLPAIWYQVQLASDDVNVYGVSIPGSPGVIIGFNKDIAWGVTNVDADVLDWYSVKFKDSTKQEYWYNNSWQKSQQRIENIPVRGGSTVQDTVIYTLHGPVVYENKPEKFSKAANIPEGYALRWVAHDGSDDVRTFYQLNRAKDYADYRAALVHYSAPAQNFVFASAGNDIAITPNGYFPLKYKDQGKFLLDGSLPANDWHGRIPADQNPTVKNPPRGFVSSANQSSTDQTYPYYINWEFAPYERAHRINNRLSAMSSATVDSIRALQNDNYSILAENILPTLIKGVSQDGLNATEREAFGIVSNWNRYFNADEIGASIFEIWQKDLGKEIWDDEFGDPKTPMRYPSRDRTVQLILNEPDSKWCDNVNTPKKEVLKDLIQKSYRFAVDSLQRKYGNVLSNWKWGAVKHSHVPHLAKLNGFGSKYLDHLGGSKTSVNAMSESNGPSWKMIVALGENVKAYGIFPGGESGNPGSFFYDDLIDTWSHGKLNELLYMRSAKQNPEKIISTWTLN